MSRERSDTIMFYLEELKKRGPPAPITSQSKRTLETHRKWISIIQIVRNWLQLRGKLKFNCELNKRKFLSYSDLSLIFKISNSFWVRWGRAGRWTAGGWRWGWRRRTWIFIRVFATAAATWRGTWTRFSFLNFLHNRLLWIFLFSRRWLR